MNKGTSCCLRGTLCQIRDQTFLRFVWVHPGRSLTCCYHFWILTVGDLHYKPVLEYCHTRTPAYSLAWGETQRSISLEQKKSLFLCQIILLTNLRRQGRVVSVGDHPGATQAGVSHSPDARPAPPGHAAVVSPGTETDAETWDMHMVSLHLILHYTCFATGQSPQSAPIARADTGTRHSPPAIHPSGHSWGPWWPTSPP